MPPIFVQLLAWFRQPADAWNAAWILPTAVIVFVVLRLLTMRIAGSLSGLRRLAFKNRMRMTFVPGLGVAGLFAQWAPPDDAPSRNRYWTLFACADGLLGAVGVAAIVTGFILWNQAIVREILLIWGGMTVALTAGMIGPGKPGKPVTDGNMLGQLAEDGPAASRYDALGRLAEQNAAGRMPEDWDTSLVLRLLEPRDGTVLQLQAIMLAYVHYMAADEVVRAEEVLERAFELSTRHSNRARAIVQMETAYYQSLHGDVSRARQLADSLDVRLVPRHSTLILSAALAIGERRDADFQSSLAQLRKLPQNPYLERVLAKLELIAGKRAGDTTDG